MSKKWGAEGVGALTSYIYIYIEQLDFGWLLVERMVGLLRNKIMEWERETFIITLECTKVVQYFKKGSLMSSEVTSKTFAVTKLESQQTCKMPNEPSYARHAPIPIGKKLIHPY